MHSMMSGVAWECSLTRPVRCCDSCVVRESPELSVAGVYGVRLQLRPNMCGKVEMGLLAPQNVELQFSVTISWTSTDDRGLPELKERGRFEGRHFFQGGWIREVVAYSSAMRDTMHFVIGVSLQQVHWARQSDFLANQLDARHAREAKLAAAPSAERTHTALGHPENAGAPSEMEVDDSASGAEGAHGPPHRGSAASGAPGAPDVSMMDGAEVSAASRCRVQDARACALARAVRQLSTEAQGRSSLESAALDPQLEGRTQQELVNRLKRLRVQDPLCMLCLDCQAALDQHPCGVCRSSPKLPRLLR
mmetsp:Transcript_30232/g.84923  ORF Transcript_30232/g.84923 Transcript_30232/m.84923 type:complete len:306 (+) Transcript_30232:35-952(+)